VFDERRHDVVGAPRALELAAERDSDRAACGCCAATVSFTEEKSAVHARRGGSGRPTMATRSETTGEVDSKTSASAAACASSRSSATTTQLDAVRYDATSVTATTSRNTRKSSGCGSRR